MQNVKQLLDQPNYFIRLLFLGQQKYFEAGFCSGVENTPLLALSTHIWRQFSLISLAWWYIIATAFATTDLDAAIRRSRDSEIAPTAQGQRR